MSRDFVSRIGGHGKATGPELRICY
uniref:Uncharacterized protein n=1 Tax=Arundo donax TaxID=35708 RepID=A0A0A9LXZ9_ARUDO